MSEIKINKEKTTTVNELYEILEQQKKLEDVKAMVLNTIEKVNQSINSITVSYFSLKHHY